MKHALIIGCCAAFLVAGCAPAAVDANGETNVAKSADLAVSLTIPKRSYCVGETMQVVVTVANLTGQPKTIAATTAAPVQFVLTRETQRYNPVVKKYPQFAAPAMSPWTLAPGQVRSFEQTLTVEPDWPREELLRLTANIAGRPDAAPSLVLIVTDPGK